jgi:acetoin utilization protein AcuB
MSKNPITTTPDASVPDALKVMQGSKVRQLPVLSSDGALMGIVSLTDLFRASPSPATSLSIWEVNYLLEKIKVSEVMTHKVITVTEDTAVEEAGRIMAEAKVSGLPVVRDGELVGIITESHLFNVLVDIFGARQAGVRVTAEMPLTKGGLCGLSGAVADAGGRFVAFTESAEENTVTFKVRDVTREGLIKTLEPLVTRIVDVRET